MGMIVGLGAVSLFTTSSGAEIVPGAATASRPHPAAARANGAKNVRAIPAWPRVHGTGRIATSFGCSYDAEPDGLACHIAGFRA
jgi:hypothetical protein